MIIQFLNELPHFLLVLVRVSAFFVTVPLFSYRTIPAMHKVGLAVFLAWLMLPNVDKPSLDIDSYYFALILKEAIVGLVIGLIAFVVISAVQIVGHFIDYQMGLAIASVIDPQTGTQTPIMGQYFYIFALILLLVLNGHHMLLDGIFYSYKIIPLGQAWIAFDNGNLPEFVTKIVASSFVIAFQMATPVVGVLFLTDVALGLVSRTVPQLNVFVVGLPLKILVGLLIMIIIMPVFFMLFQHLFEYMFYSMRGLMEHIGGT